jgi:hypothetical protein
MKKASFDEKSQQRKRICGSHQKAAEVRLSEKTPPREQAGKVFP